MPFGVPFQGFGLPEVWFVSDSSKDFVDQFLENHINPPSCLVLVIDHVVLLPFELPFALGSRTSASFYLPDVVLQPGEHFNLGHEYEPWSGGSIPSMSWENSVWCLGTSTLGTGLIAWATDPIGMMSLPDVTTVQPLSLSRRSPPRLRLALRISRRSVLEGVWLGDTLHLLDITDFLLLWLSKLHGIRAAFYIDPLEVGGLILWSFL
ncbi:hypothetical protein Acr_27g0002030 [Actinidia rufa]|uniref:Uncharacterized protein n=1 Tax=Actinidia rufa TaxID=165716 RepID=A0A7J0H6S8_9ERIC|nr:hypothetical protein Acr_27g0002030 [Actinidia rufa]